MVAAPQSRARSSPVNNAPPQIVFSDQAAVLIYIATRIFRVHDLRAIARFDHFEFALALISQAGLTAAS